MELEKQVANLELSRRLKDLGVRQESLFYWLWKKYDEGEEGHFELVNWCDGQRSPVAAFTVAELGEMLPDRFRADKRDGKWWGTCEELLKPETANTETDVRAKMLVYLMENNFLTV